MNRKWAVLLCVSILIVTIVLPAGAITNGVPDDGEHPYVGILVFFDTSNQWMRWCSGSLITERLVVTASHCFEPSVFSGLPAAYVQVYFNDHIDADYETRYYPDEGYYYSSTFIEHPKYDITLPFPETYDIGVVVLDQPVEGVTEFAQLPELYFLDEIANSEKRDVILTLVGYGVNDSTPTWIIYYTRHMAQTFLISLENWITDGWNLQTSGSAGNWVGSEEYYPGGTCSGDSGGATLFGGPESNLLVGVITAGNSPGCIGKGISWRTDLPESLDFLHDVAETYGIVLP